MRYLPHVEEDIRSMLERIGQPDLDGLFATIPADCRRREEMDLPEPLTEWELSRHLADLAARQSPQAKVFLGAGSYEHFIPETVKQLLGRSEFYTAYTPYQPEMSQGTLQAIFEYQTLTARLLGLETANASLYDGSTALAEALLMGLRVNKKKRVAVSQAVHPSYRQVAATYFRPTGFEIVELPYGPDGRTDLSSLEGLEDLAAVALQSPNFFGCIEDLAAAADKAHQKGALFITAFTEALAYGLLNSPGTLGADVACGEGQSLGVPRSFGGPGLGMMATLNKYVRNVPGRLVGQTVDLEGRRGFVLTLATREQHIRREKAVSNICTNNSLCALAAAMYMASLGSSGLRELAALNHDKAEYLKKELAQAGCPPTFPSPFFNEFVVRFPDEFPETHRRLAEQGLVAGLPLGEFYPELAGHYLLCATEVRTREEMDELVREVSR
ncbi:MAG: aminomethyl-transferring glycine dehydrogenase subunit GcvPA [Thermodesulfobacteriota bacterium]